MGAKRGKVACFPVHLSPPSRSPLYGLCNRCILCVQRWWWRVGGRGIKVSRGRANDGADEINKLPKRKWKCTLLRVEFVFLFMLM